MSLKDETKDALTALFEGYKEAALLTPEELTKSAEYLTGIVTETTAGNTEKAANYAVAANTMAGVAMLRAKTETQKRLAQGVERGIAILLKVLIAAV